MARKRLTGPKFLIHVVTFVFLLGIDVADLLCDWLFYADVSMIEPGLVYGVPDQHAVNALLAFSVIGSVTFFVECINLWLEFFKGGTCIDSDVLSATVVWVEDVPQIVLSLYLALCREEAISVFQLMKAVVVTLGIFVRLLVLVVKFCHDNLPDHHKKIKAVIAAGTLVELGCAVGIFILTQTELSGAGEVAFRVPTTVLEERYNDHNYFTNVSVFASKPRYFDHRGLDPDKLDKVVNWLQLTPINNIRYGVDDTFSLRFETKGTDALKMAVWVKRDQKWQTPDCYEVNHTLGVITREANITCGSDGYFGHDSSQVFIRFQYDPPKRIFKKRLFGQIYYNAKILENGTCTGLDRNSDVIGRNPTDPEALVLHYFRTDVSAPGAHVHFPGEGGAARFFRNEKPELTDVKEVWKTGWKRCETTGSLAPVLDTDLEVECSRN